MKEPQTQTLIEFNQIKKNRNEICTNVHFDFLSKKVHILISMDGRLRWHYEPHVIYSGAGYSLGRFVLLNSLLNYAISKGITHALRGLGQYRASKVQGRRG